MKKLNKKAEFSLLWLGPFAILAMFVFWALVVVLVLWLVFYVLAYGLKAFFGNAKKGLMSAPKKIKKTFW